MAHSEPRFHLLNLRVLNGTSNEVDFNLNPGSRLVHASANIGTTGPPIRAVILLIQPRASATVFQRLTGGWMRGMGGIPSSSHDLTWDGDIPIGTDMAVRFQASNDTGDVAGFGAFISVVE